MRYEDLKKSSFLKNLRYLLTYHCILSITKTYELRLRNLRMLGTFYHSALRFLTNKSTPILIIVVLRCLITI